MWYETSTYDFELPEAQIAQVPSERRDGSRLMVIDRVAGKWSHHSFSDLPSLLPKNSLLVANNTRVIPARLRGERWLGPDFGTYTMGGQIEFLLLEEKAPLVWEGLFRSAAGIKPGIRFVVGDVSAAGAGEKVVGSFDSASGKPRLWGEIVASPDGIASTTGTAFAKFSRDPVSSGLGQLPLPPYIERKPGESDIERYQTVYASSPGSVAAPTAGLHFTPQILKELSERGHGWTEVTLNVGVGTFRPVKVDDLREHAMHEERYEVPLATAQAIAQAKSEMRAVVAVGTTSVRTLESAWKVARLRYPERDQMALFTELAGAGKSALFLHPGAPDFKVVDAMVTNFHLPRSSLLMLVCAFGGTELMLSAYREAVREGYRFFSYGDAMLIR